MARPLPFKSRTMIDCSQAAHPLAGILAHWPVAEEIALSETAMTLLGELDADWALMGADLDGADYHIDAEARTITVHTEGLANHAIARSRHFQNALTLRSFAAIRAAWTAEREADAFAMHRVDTWPLLARVIEADTAAMTLRMAYDLRCAEIDGPWRHALGEANGDMAADYQRALSRTPDHQDDGAAIASAFLQWFAKPARVHACDFQTLTDMDDSLAELTLEGRTLSEGAIRCLSLDPLTGLSYLGAHAGEIAGNPSWRNIADPVAEAHFAQVMDEIGATRIGHVAMRDAKLAARLFPGLLADPADLCLK